MARFLFDRRLAADFHQLDEVVQLPVDVAHEGDGRRCPGYVRLFREHGLCPIAQILHLILVQMAPLEQSFQTYRSNKMVTATGFQHR